MKKTFGVSLADVLGKRLWDLFPDAIGNRFHQAFQRVSAGGGAEFFDHFYEPFEKWFHNRVELVDDLVHVVAGDVTDDVR